MTPSASMWHASHWGRRWSKDIKQTDLPKSWAGLNGWSAAEEVGLQRCAGRAVATCCGHCVRPDTLPTTPPEEGWNGPPSHMSLGHIDCFELKALKQHKMQERLSSPIFPFGLQNKTHFPWEKMPLGTRKRWIFYHLTWGVDIEMNLCKQTYKNDPYLPLVSLICFLVRVAII